MQREGSQKMQREASEESTGDMREGRTLWASLCLDGREQAMEARVVCKL